MKDRPVFGSAMHIASRARSRVSRGVSGAAGAGAPFAPLPPGAGGLSFGALRTRSETKLGSVSRRSATSRISSSLPTTSPIAASTGATSARVRSRPAASIATPERGPHPEARQIDRALDQLMEATEPVACSMSAGSSPRHRRHPEVESLPPATRCARIIASAPARSASSARTATSVKPASIVSCSGVIAVPIIATASSTPAWWRASTSV